MRGFPGVWYPHIMYKKTGVLAKAVQRNDVWEFLGGGYPQTKSLFVASISTNIKKTKALD